MGIVNVEDIVALDDSGEISMSFLTIKNRG